MTTLPLTLLGAIRDIPAEPLPPATSPHSGRPLRRFALKMRVPADRCDELNSELQAAAGLSGKPLQGPDATWRLSGDWSSHSRGERPEIYTYNVDIQEEEELQASALEIAGLTLIPAQYSEEIHDGTIAVSLVTEVSDDEGERLEDLLTSEELGEEYFDVVRHGVSDTPLRMRFGRCVWQRGEGDTRRHNLTLVADEGQSPESSVFGLVNQPQLHRTTEKSVATANALDLLLEELHSQGVLTEDALTRIKAAATPKKITPSESREFYRTDQLADFWN
ncbi:hypothetical protein ACLQ2C_36465 [Streptomyces sp. DT73]|uniref:hypothetical protein n=1 Tax=Streptomyces sp. DT73 TaxID=3393420 RepID=UPI003CF66353